MQDPMMNGREFFKLLCLSYEILNGAAMYINGSCQSGRESAKENAHLHKLDAFSKRSDARVTVELLVSYAWMLRKNSKQVVDEVINDTRGYVCPNTTQDFDCLKSK